jgi:benzoyl-CoA reductase/2-hydroxyglutaryl-CoA dehydratase subunit BcrC/BadD/HgdB
MMSPPAPQVIGELSDRSAASSMEIIVTSRWVPVEWIAAHGFAPRGVWSLVGHAAGAVAEGVCAFAHAARSLPETLLATPVIYSTACDQIRRAADATGASVQERVFLFNLPATWQTSVARQLYHTEVKRLGKFLQRLGGHAPCSGELEAMIHRYEERRTRLREFVKHSPGRQATEVMARLLDGGVLPPESAKHQRRGVPLALVGGPLCPSQWKLFDTIESAGGQVVLNATEPGERCLLPPASEVPGSGSSESDGCCAGTVMLAQLCDRYFDHIVDVFQRPNSRLYSWLGTRLAERQVRGIVLWVHIGCDLWRAEAASFREAFGLPVLVLDSLGSRAGGLRDLTRLDAFIESLQ